MSRLYRKRYHNNLSSYGSGVYSNSTWQNSYSSSYEDDWQEPRGGNDEGYNYRHCSYCYKVTTHDLNTCDACGTKN
jgi:hypothetical protein